MSFKIIFTIELYVQLNSISIKCLQIKNYINNYIKKNDQLTLKMDEEYFALWH